MSRTGVLNYGLYTAGWLACVLGAARGHPASGTLVAVVLVVAHVGLSRDRVAELRLIGALLALGAAVETLHRHAGLYVVASGQGPSGLPAPWLLALWAQFATTFRFTLRGVLRIPVRAALLGAAGGPVAFVAAERLGALTLARPVSWPLLLLAISWTLALLAGSALTRRSLGPGRVPPAYRI